MLVVARNIFFLRYARISGLRRCSSEDIFECRTSLYNLYGLDKNKFSSSTSFNLQRSNSFDVTNQDIHLASHQSGTAFRSKRFLHQTSSIDEETSEASGK